MNRAGLLRVARVSALLVFAACPRKAAPPGHGDGQGGPAPTAAGHAAAPRPPRPPLGPLTADQVYVYQRGTPRASAISADDARARGLLVVDLRDDWAPFILQDVGPAKGDTPKPNAYRATFVALANDRVDPDGLSLAHGGHNFLEPFGIPPTLSVLLGRAEADALDARRACEEKVDEAGLRAFTGNAGYVDRERARRDFVEAGRDSDWLDREIAKREAALAAKAAGTGAATAGPAGGAIGAGGATTPVSGARGAIETAVPPATTAATTAATSPATSAATSPATWAPGDRGAALAALRADEKTRARAERFVRGQERLRAVRALQARLQCQGLLAGRGRVTSGAFDLPTHEALAEWERQNDIFGWGMLGGETQAALLRPPLALDLDTFRRVLAERLADAAGIVEDGSAASLRTRATYKDEDGTVHPVPNLIEEHVNAFLKEVGVTTPEDMLDFLRQHGSLGFASLRIALPAPALPPYYLAAQAPSRGRQVAGVSSNDGRQAAGVSSNDGRQAAGVSSSGGRQAAGVSSNDGRQAAGVSSNDGRQAAGVSSSGGRQAAGAPLDLSVEIDRGDVWYDFPFDARGRPVEQTRTHYPHVTLYVTWHGQRIALAWWRTTIGSWRSELSANGKVYYRYKNSDVGPRLWKEIVAGPVWIPPDGTPAKDLLVRKVLDREQGPVTVVNTDVMGPGFQSAYGLVMAIHIDRGGRDNQIRTHGSVDYTSIARRFSHGCHRLVNNRAVRLFDFVLRHTTYRRVGSVPLQMKRKLEVDAKTYTYALATRGYYYELARPIPVAVTEGRIMGAVKKPIGAYVRKAGVDYGDAADPDAAESAGGPGQPRAVTLRAARRAEPSDGDAATSARTIGGSRAAPPPPDGEGAPASDAP